jgi:uncharacterized protein VirK/YbjX
MVAPNMLSNTPKTQGITEGANGYRYWSYRRILRGFLYLPSLFSTVPSFIDILRSLSGIGWLTVLCHHPTLPFKYLSSFYLIRDLSVRSRGDTMAYHYRHLLGSVDPSLARRLMAEEVPVFEYSSGGSLCRICLKIPPCPIKEGELSLGLELDGREIYTLSFSFVSGKIAGLTDEPAVLVARLQGTRNSLAEIQTAGRLLQDVSPPAMLLSALQGVARVFNVYQFVGVSSAQHVCGGADSARVAPRSYDTFFVTAGAGLNDLGYYVGALPLPHKPISQIKPCHRSRSLRKRRFKAEVADLVYQRLQNTMPKSPAAKTEPALEWDGGGLSQLAGPSQFWKTH